MAMWFMKRLQNTAQIYESCKFACKNALYIYVGLNLPIKMRATRILSQKFLLNFSHAS